MSLKQPRSAGLFLSNLIKPMKFKSVFLLILPFLMLSVAFSAIKRVEPAFWWAGMKDPFLQVLIHGDSIGGAEVRLSGTQITVERIERVENDNFLFVYLDTGRAVAGERFKIILERNNTVIEEIDYELKERLGDSRPIKGFDNSDVMYLITPDRFANGDPSNDSVPGMRETAVDRNEPYGRHGGDLQGIIDNLDYLAELGITAIWLNPILENDMPESSYHGYAITDYYKVDPRYGTNEQYLDLADKARERGIKIVMDVVFNHSGVEHWWMKDMPSSDWINFYPDYQVTNHNRTTHQDPYAAQSDADLMTQGWFVPSMPDLNLRNPLMKDYLIQNSIWWIEYLGLGGFRQDTYPYPDKHAMAEWCERVMHEYPDFNITGEEWSLNPSVLAYWQDGKENADGYDGNLPSLLDFPVQDSLERALKEEETWGTGWRTLYETLGTDHVYPDPFNNVIFLGNHDKPRFYMEVGKSLNAYKNGLAFILTSRGIPHLYYGDEILMTHDESDGHGHIRNDFPGGWAGDEVNGFTGVGLASDEMNALHFTRTLLNWRKGNLAVQEGSLMHFAPEDAVYVYFRTYEDQKVMVALNKNTEPYFLKVDRFEAAIGDATVARDVVRGFEVSLADMITLTPGEPSVFELR